MKLGIVISGTNAETNWNALRLANFSLKKGDEVKIFLVGEGVEYVKNTTEKFNVEKQGIDLLDHRKATIQACGTCLEVRHQESTESCPISTLADFYSIVEWADKVLTF